jgi:hypothetical protein
MMTRTEFMEYNAVLLEMEFMDYQEFHGDDAMLTAEDLAEIAFINYEFKFRELERDEEYYLEMLQITDDSLT